MRSVLIISTVILSCVFSSDSIAQTVKAGDRIDQSYINLNDDMKTYEVICKEHAKEYGDYYKVVRERIVKKLRYNYTDHYRNGEVELYFVLNSNGSLKRIDVDTGKSTSDERLIGVALSSIQQASPFPPFPKELDAAQLPFSLMISFREDNN